MRTLLMTLCLLLNVSVAISGTIDPNVPDKKYIEYGEKFSCVVRICGKYNDDTGFCGSAVVIKPNWIITAAHVVYNHKSAKIVDKSNKDHKISKVIPYKDFKMNNFGEGDIALCYIEDPIEIDFYPDLYTDSDEGGKICSISGFGFTGNFNTGATEWDEKHRAGSNRIDTIDKDLLVCSPSPKGSKDRTSLEYLIASGDSGGGLFIDKKLAGIHSLVMAEDKKSDSDYGDESGHTRVSLYIEWIDSIINSPDLHNN